jgi:hypothetical protein
MRSLAKYNKWALAGLVAFFVALLINHLVFKFKEGADGDLDASGKPVVAGPADGATTPVDGATTPETAPARSLLPKTLNELESELDVLKTKQAAFERIIASNQLSADALKVSSTAKQAEIDARSNAQAVAEMEKQ